MKNHWTKKQQIKEIINVRNKIRIIQQISKELKNKNKVI